MTQPSMSPKRVSVMVSVLMRVPALKAPASRALYQSEVEDLLGGPLGIVADGDTQTDLIRLVRACEREEQGLETLIHVVDIYNRGSGAVGDLKALMAEWERERQLIALLHEFAVTDLVALIEQVTGVRPVARQIGTAVQEIGWEPDERWGVPTIVAVVDAIAQAPGAPSEIGQWLRAVAPTVGVDPAAMAQLRRAIHHLLQPPPATGSERSREDLESTVKRFIIEETGVLGAQAAIRGGIPARNPYFTGREDLIGALHRTLGQQQRASVLPETALYGFGGVGKTQIAVEFAYRHAADYQLIWWIPAEDQSTVRASLAALADRLGLPSSGNMEQTVRSALDALASTTSLTWLLVYDNADDPAALENLVPSTGGHVLVTSRNPAWSAASPVLEVDVFDRPESKELLRKRNPDLSDHEADRLSDALGDLPLALEQAVSWLLTTMSSVDDYLHEFRHRSSALMSEGRPRQYPHTVLTFVAMAIQRLREEAPVAAQLLELVAFLGPDPVSTALLWEGRGAELTEPLRGALQERNDIARAVRDLGRYGLARLEKASRRMSVHRLVQLVLREELVTHRRDDGLRNARRLLAAANPGYPDDRATWPRHAEIRSHVRAADLIHGDLEQRRTVMDHLRYIFNTGDFESCQTLAEEIIEAWDRPVADGGHGPDDHLTLLAYRRYADALRSLGDRRAVHFGRVAMDRMRESLGERDEYTLGAMMGVAADLRIAGDFAAARELDDRNLQLHYELLGPGHPSTLRAMNSVAINHRWAGDFQGAHDLDVEAEQQSIAALGELEPWTFFAVEGQARDLVGLGRYTEALQVQQRVLPAQIELLGEHHLTVLRAKILIGAMLRKIGRIPEALAVAHENYRNHTIRFGLRHDQTIHATVTYANTLRAAGEPAQALSLITDACASYRDLFGPRHPLTLCAEVNQAIVQRAGGYDRDALALDERILPVMREVLGTDHPFTLALEVNHSGDLSRAHRLREARELSTAAWQRSIDVRGADHPYTLHAAVDAANDMIQTDDADRGEALLAQTITALEQVYGVDHPECHAARHYRRLECDLEPPVI